MRQKSRPVLRHAFAPQDQGNPHLQKKRKIFERFSSFWGKHRSLPRNRGGRRSCGCRTDQCLKTEAEQTCSAS